MNILHDAHMLQQELERERQARIEAEQLAARLTKELQESKRAIPGPEAEYAQIVLRLSLQGELLYVNAAGEDLLAHIGSPRVPALQRLLLRKAGQLKPQRSSLSLETAIRGKYFLPALSQPAVAP